MAPANRNIDALLANLERQMTTLEQERENSPEALDLATQLSDADLLEIALVIYEIGVSSGMLYPEALERVVGLQPDRAEMLAAQLQPLAVRRLEERIRLHEGSL